MVCRREQRGTQPVVGEWLHHLVPAATCQESGRNRQVSSHQGPRSAELLCGAGRKGRQELGSSHTPASCTSFLSSSRLEPLFPVASEEQVYQGQGQTHCLGGSGWRAIQTVSLRLRDYICQKVSRGSEAGHGGKGREEARSS